MSHLDLEELSPSYVESARRSGGWERAEHRAVLPGKHGLECSVYQYLRYKTLHLRREVYVTFATEGVEFRPATNEHIPHGELIRYQMKNVFAVGGQSYGEGRSLEVVFACYCPEGSGAADLAVRAIRGALEELRDVARLPERERSKFGLRYGMKSTLIKMREPATCYRPPAGALPYRTGPPTAPLFSGTSFSEGVDALLSSWGHKDLADEMRRNREEASRERRALRELERQADPFGIGTAARRDDLATPRAWEAQWEAQWEAPPVTSWEEPWRTP